MPRAQRAERGLAAAQKDRCACSGVRVPPGPASTLITHRSRGLCFGPRPAPCPLPQVLQTTDSFCCSAVTSLESPFLTSQFKSYSEVNHVTWPFKICFIKPSESTPEMILLFPSFSFRGKVLPLRYTTCSRGSAWGRGHPMNLWHQ